MKQLFSVLTFLVFILFSISCKKDKQDMELSPAFYPACTNVLDDWKINVFPLPEVQRQNDVFFVNEETGFTVGNAGTILKTTNGGKDWVLLERYYDLSTQKIVEGALTKARLLTVFFVDEQVGYVGGGGENTPISGKNIDAVLLKTTNGGQTWSKQYLPEVRDVKDLHFFDAENGIGLFSTNDENDFLKYKLFTTHNAGENWEPLPMPNLTVSSTQFDIGNNSLGVWVVEDYFSSKYLRTTDQGATWQEIQTPSINCIGVSFKSNNEGYAHCDGKSYKTTDSGFNWEEYTVKTPTGATLVRFQTITEGFAIVPIYDYVSSGGETNATLNSFEVHQTTDGGTTWDKTLIDKECDFTGTAFSLSDDMFYTVGWNAVNKFELK